MLKINNTSINPSKVIYNGIELSELQFGGIKVWPEKENDKPKDNQIFYTTVDNKISSVVDHLDYLVSHTYENGLGIITFNRNITVAQMYLFNKSDNLKTVTLPLSITEIENAAFQSCPNLISVEGMDNVTEMGVSVFSKSTSLPSAIIPNGVTIINNGLFDTCTSLKTIYIHNGVTEIKLTAFASCSSLSDIYYDGTSTQFAAIPKGSSWVYRVPTTCIVHCTDGDFPISNF